MDSKYNPVSIEQKWQKNWAEQNQDQTPINNNQPKFYALSMFPYPSGNLHMGHVRNYTITDVIARLKRMQGYRVLHPMGWDAFGLPAENAAIDRGIPPAKWTLENIAQMKEQLRRLGFSIDWDKEVATCTPEYYRWTQWIFLQFFQAGLAYQKESAVNWDPIDQTVLANEQVDGEGRSWRSGAKVERKMLRQWFFKITDYAEQLLNDLDKLPGWPERVKLMQANWIGKSVGAYLEFPIVGMDQKIGVFTTRPDTVYGVSYVVLAPEHPLTAKVTTPEQQITVETFIKEVAAESELERTAEDKPKRGVPTGGKAINPFNNQEVPIWIADYVLYEYGTGAVMGVPAHDVRDFQFAKQYNLPIKTVIVPDDSNDDHKLTEAYTDVGVMVNSGPFNGEKSTVAKKAIIELAEDEGYGKGRVQYRLRDWLISRQRYWGAPIPIIHCPKCGAVPVPDEDLPVKLPESVEFSGRGPSPLAKLEDWVNVSCPSCGTPAKRETDTMDTFIDSSWYYLRYPDATNEEQVFDSKIVNDWLPVDQYVGGIEHAILHLLYSRFFTKVLRDRGLCDFDEPFQNLLTQGMVQGVTYKNPVTGKYIPFADVNPQEPKDPKTGDKLEVFFEKMSKSKYNGVDPMDVMATYGADTARMFILFKAPPEKDLEWDDADVQGQFRFLNRVWSMVMEFLANHSFSELKAKHHGITQADLKDLGWSRYLITEITKNISAFKLRNVVKVYPVEDVLVAIEAKFNYSETQQETKDDLQKVLTWIKSRFGGELTKAEKDVRRAVHNAIKEVTEDLDGDYQFNTAVSEMMKLSNALGDASCKDSPIYAEALETLLLLLAPFAPHITEELWQIAGNFGSVHTHAWPKFDPEALVVDEITLVIQIKGKTRGTIQVPAQADKETLEKLARESDIAQRHLAGKEIKKVIVVPRKLVNFVVI